MLASTTANPGLLPLVTMPNTLTAGRFEVLTLAASTRPVDLTRATANPGLLLLVTIPGSPAMQGVDAGSQRPAC